jgi:hypothetical protein
MTGLGWKAISLSIKENPRMQKDQSVAPQISEDFITEHLPWKHSFVQRKYALAPLLWGSQLEVVISPLPVKNKVNSYVQTVTLLMG